jgi:hypothetical protein
LIAKFNFADGAILGNSEKNATAPIIAQISKIRFSRDCEGRKFMFMVSLKFPLPE